MVRLGGIVDEDEFRKLTHLFSHETRTPMSYIEGYVRMIRRDTVGRLDSRVDKILTQIELSTKRMVGLWVRNPRFH